MKTAVPRWLPLLLLPILPATLFVVHYFVQTAAIDIGTMPHTRNFELAGLLLSAVLGPAVTALLFAYPIARLYTRYSGVVASLISAPTFLYWASTYFHNSGRPFVITTYVIELASLAVFVPVAARLVYRRFVCSTSRVAPA